MKMHTSQLPKNKVFGWYSYVKIGLLVCMSLYLANCWSLLWTNPWQERLAFNTPTLAVRNKNGITAIVDNFYSRCIIFDKHGKYIASIDSSANLSAKTVACFADIALSDEYLYVLDNRSSDGTNVRQGVRMMRFHFDGKYVDTIFQQPYSNETEESLISSISWQNGSIYCQGMADDCLKWYKLTDGKLKCILEKKFPGVHIWFSEVNGENDIGVCAKNGKFYLSKDGGENFFERNDFGPTQHVTSCAFNSRNELFVVDGNRRAIYLLPENKGAPIEVAKTNGIWLEAVGEELIYCDPAKQTVSIVNPYTKVQRHYSDVFFSPLTRFNRWLVFADAVVLLAILLFTVGRYALNCLKNMRAIDETLKKTQTNQEEEVYTINLLYGKKALLLLLAFCLAVCIFVPPSYKANMRRNLDVVKELAEYISQTSPLHLGSYLANLKVPAGTQTLELQKIRQCCALLDTAQEKSSVFMRDYAVFKSLDAKSLMLVDSSDEVNYCGAILTSDSPAELPRQVFEPISRGERVIIGAYSDEMPSGYCAVFVPLFDSSRTVTGMLALYYSRAWIKRAVIHQLFLLCVELLVLFIAAVFIISEGTLCWQFYKKHRNNLRLGIKNQTVIEAHRTLNFLVTLLSAWTHLYLPILAIKLAQDCGYTDNLNFWAALPITIRLVIVFIGNGVFGLFVNRNPRLYFIGGGVLRGIISPILCILCVIYHQYWLMVAVMVPAGIGHSMLRSAVNAMAGSGLQPEKRFRHLVFTYVEYTIAVSIAGAIGGFLYEKFGTITAYLGMMFCALVMLALTLIMVQSDLNDCSCAENKQAHQEKKTGILGQLRFFLVPQVIGYSVFIIFLFGFLNPLQGFVFPLYLRSIGESLHIASLASIICPIVATVLVSCCLSLKPDFGKNSMLFKLQFALGACILIFAFRSNAFTYCFIILAYLLLSSVVKANCQQTFVPFAQQRNVSFGAIAGCFSLIETFGNSISSLVLGWLLTKGAAILGEICGMTLIISTAVYMIFSKMMQKYGKGDC